MNARFEKTAGLPIRPGIILGKRYRIVSCLGAGGCGVVYLALDLSLKEFVALKTFRDQFVADLARRKAFEREALLWVMLGRHCSILEAKGVEYLQGRLFIVMEYVRSDFRRRVSLADYLANPGRRLKKKQVIRWAIQFCRGMEYANGHGLESHGDIKPGNLLITPRGDLKIGDFGVARAGQASWPSQDCSSGGALDPEARQRAAHLLSSESNLIRGTLGYIAPEVLQGQAADVRSDIYSFGLVLYQLATRHALPPFLPTRRLSLADFVRQNLYKMASQCVPRVRGPLGSIVEKCLQPDPTARFGSFAELREALAGLHKRGWGRQALPTKTPVIGPDELLARGASLLSLDRPDQAAECFRDAIRLAPSHALAWVGLGEAALRVGRMDEAGRHINRAIILDLRCGTAWRTKGMLLEKLGLRRVALRCYQKAVALDADDPRGWLAIGGLLARLGLVDEARNCLEETLAKDLKNAAAWECRGLFQAAQAQFVEAIESYKFALLIDPQSESALVNMGIALDALNRHRDAIACYKEALEINPYSVAALSNKATSLAASGYFHLAIANCNQALELQEALSHAWQVKSLCLIELGRDGDALEGLLRATELDSSRAHAWLSRGDLEASLGMFDEANNSWGRACEASGGRDKALEEQVRQRFDEFRRATPNGAISVLPCSPTSLLAWQPAEPKMRPPLPRTRTTTA